ncbi:MAG TPA: OmpH family outer membrane protein [Flavobacterium sp.]
MRKEFLLLFLALTLSASGTFQAQTKGTKVGYIDMEYILQNVPDYTEAQNQLEQKAQKWKQEIEAKKIEINKLKEALKAEKALLTKGLIEERIAEIVFLENETLEYQQKKFGPDGELMKQKAGLTKPIQDQVFTAVQDIAEAKRYDFIFDKTSDLTMIFAAKRFDISDQIIRILNRTEKREQLTKKQLKEEAAREAKEDAIDENPALQDRQKTLDAKKAARDKIIADRKLRQEELKLKIQADKDAKKAGVAPTPNTENASEKEVPKTAAEEAKQKQLDEKTLALEARKKATEDKKKAQEEKRKQTLAEREAKKTGTVSETTVKEGKKTPDTKTEPVKENTKITEEEAKQKQADARAKTIEERTKVIEERKKALEEKKKKILEEREAAKKAAEEKSKTTN